MRSYFKATHHALLLAGCSVLALGLSAGMAQAKGTPPAPALIKQKSVVISTSTY